MAAWRPSPRRWPARARDREDPRRAARGRRGGAPAGAPPRRRRRRRRLSAPALRRPALPRPRRPRTSRSPWPRELPVPVIASGDVATAAPRPAGAAGAAASPPSCWRAHAVGAPWLFEQVLDGRVRAVARRNASSEVRRFADEVLQPRWGRARWATCASSGSASGAPARWRNRWRSRLMQARDEATVRGLLGMLIRARLRERVLCPILACHFGTRLRSGAALPR